MDQRVRLSTIAVLWATLFASSVSSAADIAQFSLAGVRLGMSPDEARRAVSEYLQVSESALKTSPPLNDPLMERPLSKSISYSSPDLELTIGLAVANPEDKSSALVVGMVAYKPLRAEEAAQLKDFAVETYGEPSDRSMEDADILLWCSQPQTGRCSWSQPGLSYSKEDGLMLDDPRFHMAYHEAFGRRLAR
jgi:hypothetical protein